MSAIVDFTFYSTVYMGTEVDETSFPALCARAEDVIGSMTRWTVDGDNISQFPSRTQTLYRKAICAQVDFLSINGVEALSDAGGGGFTVGKVTVQARTTATAAGAMAAAIAPMATQYLEQTGLMNPQVESVERWW